MPEIRFYHLRRDTAERAVPDLLTKGLARGHKILLKLPDTARRQFYDDWLWRFKAESFLPHAQDGDPMPEMQPVWLSTANDAPNGAQMAVIVEGAELPPIEKFELVFLMFSSENPAELEKSRCLWKNFKQQGDLNLAYWQQQDDGRWVQQSI